MPHRSHLAPTRLGTPALIGPSDIRLRDRARLRLVAIWAPLFCAAGLALLVVVPGVSPNDHRAALGGAIGCVVLAGGAYSAQEYMRLGEQLAIVLGGILIISGLTATLDHTAGLPFFSLLPLLSAAYLLPTRISIPVNIGSVALVGAAIAIRPDGMDWLLLGEVSMINGAATAITRSLRDSRNTLIDNLEQLAATDALTGLANRGTFDNRSGRLMERARIDGAPLALVMFDLDHFKALNDRAGHAAGDAALVAFAELLAGASRPTDVVARIGGEEFVAVMPGVSGEGALGFAERVVKAVREQSMADASLTVSAGVAALRPDTRDLRALLSEADGALYLAKAAGRDRAELARPQTHA